MARLAFESGDERLAVLSEMTVHVRFETQALDELVAKIDRR